MPLAMLHEFIVACSKRVTVSRITPQGYRALKTLLPATPSSFIAPSNLGKFVLAGTPEKLASRGSWQALVPLEHEGNAIFIPCGNAH